MNQGVQTRTFSYSSLSRLLSATNPESGTISYQYDLNGNLTQKDDARGVRTNYVYDVLNRVTNRNYSTPSGTPQNYQTTPNVVYTYKTSAPGLGNLTKVESSVSTTEYTSFDILGRVTGHKQTTDGEEYGTNYTYNLSGALVEQTYPSGRKVKNVLDNNGDLSMTQSAKCLDSTPGTNAACTSQAGLWNYAKNFTYNAAGAVTSMQLGNNRWESTVFNSRLQPTQIALGTVQNGTDKLKFEYGYGTTANNGNVLSQKITVKRPSQSDLVFDQLYTYDSLNRITSAEEKTGTTVNWNQTYTFDRYGNRNFNESLTTTLPKGCVDGSTPVVCGADKNIFDPDLNPANNRMATGQGWAYDAAGNVITDPEGRTFTYDAENKQIEVENSSSQTIGEYFFDGDGKRVKKYVPSTGEITIFVYDAGAKIIGEYSTIVEEQDPKVQYPTNDHLGSPRINTDQNGNVTSRTDYMPYGEEIIALGDRTANENYVTDTIRQGFTGYENDAETGLDFAQARMYATAIGRFSSVDPVKMTEYRLVDPQQINLYGYTRNNPINLIDPSGEEIDFERDKKGELTKKGRRSKEHYDKYVKKVTELAKKDPAKYGSLLATVNKLTNSEIKYVIQVTTDDVGGGGNAEGSLTTDGQSVFVTVRNIGNNHETFSLDSRFAHELEHGRQFEDGELSFVRTSDGNWVPNPSSYDIYDELNAFKEQLKLSPQVHDDSMLQYLRRNDTSDADKAKYLSRTYEKRKDVPSNNDYLWGYSKGTLVRPNQKHPNIFGRVHGKEK